MSVCKLCLIPNTLVNAHIIPEAFFREINGETGTYLFSATAPKMRTFIGPYEKMLCQRCEDKFGHVDSYGIEILLKKFESLFHEEKITSEITAFRSREFEIDQDLLQRFFVSVLWRASVSTHDFYQHVNLGNLEKFAATAINEQIPLSNKFHVALFRLPEQTEDQRLLQKIIRNPFSDCIGGINGYRFFFGTIGAFISADTRGRPTVLDEVALKRKDTVEIIGGTFMAEGDRVAMQHFMSSASANAMSNRTLPKK